MNVFLLKISEDAEVFEAEKIHCTSSLAASPLRTGHDAPHETEVGFSTMATAETRNVSTSFEFSPNFNNKKIMCSHKEW